MLAIYILSYGNSNPERGCSINKHMLNIHDTSANQKVIEVLRFVKDYFLFHGGANNMDVPRALIKKCPLARQRWEENLQAERELKKTEEKARKEMNQKKADIEYQKKQESEIRDLKKIETKHENF